VIKEKLIPALFSLIIIASLLFGWSVRKQLLWTAEEGIGYAMGIVGSSMMLLLLLYPLRKRLSFMRSWLQVKYWFGAHMALGVLGPTLILFHSNFGLGSLNSNVALYSMLSVSLSGLLGRFFYVRIHKGLYGKKIELTLLKDKYQQDLLAAQAKEEQSVIAYLDQLHGIFEQGGIGLYSSLKIRLQSLNVIRSINRQMRRSFRLNRKNSSKVSREKINSNVALKNYLSSARQVSSYMVYESLFSWWHIIHIPLFIILIVSALVHILAVHMY
jgi:hypothetical protein